MKRSQKYPYFLVLLALFLGLSFPVFSQGNSQPTSPTNPPKPSPFPTDLFSRLGDSISDEFDDAGTKLSASIFESLTNRELFNVHVVGDLQAGVRVQRRVFDNQDILDSWTVVDIMKVPFYLPIPLLQDEIGFGNGAFGINVGLNFGGEAYHIRQISPKDWFRLRPMRAIEADLTKVQGETEGLSEEIIKGDSEYRIINKEEPTEANVIDGLGRWAFWRSQNPRIRAQYHKLWNIITHPLKIPLTAERMEAYKIGSIASYGLEGAVQLGVSAGWSGFSVSGLDFTNTRAGLGITTYLKGDFRLSLWKEAEHFAQVKLTRALNRGTSADVGSLSIEQELFSGFMVLDKNILKVKEEFIPFSISINRNTANLFEVGYRYDLRREEARLAYEEAALGRFKRSYELSLEADTGVTETFTKVSETRSTSRNYKMKLSLIFEKANSQSNSKTWATIMVDDKEYRLYSAQSLALKAYDSLWGKSELKRHLFLTTFSEHHEQSEPDTGLAMRIEGRIEDSETTSSELFEYMDEVELAIGKRDFFPRPPGYLPRLSCSELGEILGSSLEEKECQSEGDNQKKQAKYGKTSFLYQVDLTMDHLESIRSADEKTFWSIMERAFNVEKGDWKNGWKRSLSLTLNSYASFLNIPLAFINVNLHKGGRLIVAYRFYRKWKELKKVEGKAELVNAFSDLYKTLHYSPELVKATRLLAGDTPARYIVTAKSDRLWGQISEGGDGLGNPFPIIDELNRRINYDRIGPRINVDEQAEITGLSFEKVDDNTARFKFNLKNIPKHIYLRIDQSPGWGRYRNLLRIIVKNNGEFKVGENILEVRRDTKTGYLKKLRDSIFNGRHSTFLMAYSIKEKLFGSVAATRFKMPSDEDLEESEESGQEKMTPQEQGAYFL